MQPIVAGQSSDRVRDIVPLFRHAGVAVGRSANARSGESRDNQKTVNARASPLSHFDADFTPPANSRLSESSVAPTGRTGVASHEPLRDPAANGQRQNGLHVVDLSIGPTGRSHTTYIHDAAGQPGHTYPGPTAGLTSQTKRNDLTQNIRLKQSRFRPPQPPTTTN